MNTIFSNNFLSGRPIVKAMKNFSSLFTKNEIILDIGCGTKPYQHFFPCQYIGIDPLPNVQPDYVGNAWNLPFPDNHFDGIILNQSLEHIAQTEATVREVERVLKPGGKCIITVPQTMKNHSLAITATQAPVHNFDPTAEPYWRVDYYRFTKFGLMYLFQNFQVIQLQATTGYIGSLCQLLIYLFASLPHDYLFAPLYVVLNSIGYGADIVVEVARKNKIPGMEKFYHFAYSTLTINYIMVIQKHDHLAQKTNS